MRRIVLIWYFLLFAATSHTLAVAVAPEEEAVSQASVNDSYFHIDINEIEHVYLFRDVPFYDENGSVQPLGKAVLDLMKQEMWAGADEPKIYEGADRAYIHMKKLDGTHILYTLTKENEQWLVSHQENKKLSGIANEEVLEKAFLRIAGYELIEATKEYYGERRLFHSERVIDIVHDEYSDTYDVTFQVITYEGAISPPYGLDTITIRIPEYTVIQYKHEDITDASKLPLDTHGM